MGLDNNVIIGEYIKTVCSLVKNKDAHEEIKLELENHILELSDDLVSEGLSEGEAISKAISQMGDATVVGSQLNKAHKGSPDWKLLIITLLLSGFGLLSMFFMKVSGIAPDGAFLKNLRYFTIGIIIVVALYYFDYRKFYKYSKLIYCITLIVLLLTIFMGMPINRKAYFILFSLPFNIVESSVFLFIISLCGIFYNWDWSKLENELKGIGLLALPLLLIILSRSVSAGVIYVISSIVLLISSKANYKYIILIVCALFGLSFLFATSNAYRIARIHAFLNPEDDPSGNGYMILQVKKLLSKAGYFGQGLTLSSRTLPEAHTDFIFAYIVYTFGWFAGLSIVALASAFIVRVISLATSVKDKYGKLLIKGIATIFAVEFTWNILMVLGFAPITGISLPFISYGGSQFIMNMVAIGLISSIYKRRTLTVIVNANN